MDYAPPDSADLDGVHALNRAFLDRAGDRLRLGNLDGSARERLARCAFLLFTLADFDAVRWRPVFGGRYAPDLITEAGRPQPADAAIAVSAAGFLWELSRRRPYAARVVSGATLEWCNELACASPIVLFAFAASEPDLLTPCRRDDNRFWDTLTRVATSDDRAVRSAARLTALQCMLTTGADRLRERLPAAACSMPGPARRSAAEPGVSRSGRRGYNTPPDESPRNQKSDQDLRQR